MNLYLDHRLDQPWSKRYPEAPLSRIVDDLLLLARDRPLAEKCVKQSSVFLDPPAFH